MIDMGLESRIKLRSVDSEDLFGPGAAWFGSVCFEPVSGYNFVNHPKMDEIPAGSV